MTGRPSPNHRPGGNSYKISQAIVGLTRRDSAAQSWIHQPSGPARRLAVQAARRCQGPRPRWGAGTFRSQVAPGPLCPCDYQMPPRHPLGALAPPWPAEGSRQKGRWQWSLVGTHHLGSGTGAQCPLFQKPPRPSQKWGPRKLRLGQLSWQCDRAPQASACLGLLHQEEWGTWGSGPGMRGL